MWLTKFKVALVQKDTKKLKSLLESTPEFTNIEDAKHASFLLKEGIELLHKLKNDTAFSMKQIKKNIDFLKATHTSSFSKLDIRS